MPQFLQSPGFWASCVLGDLELIICLLDSIFPERSLPGKHFAEWLLRIYSILPREMDINMLIL